MVSRSWLQLPPTEREDVIDIDDEPAAIFFDQEKIKTKSKEDSAKSAAAFVNAISEMSESVASPAKFKKVKSDKKRESDSELYKRLMRQSREIEKRNAPFFET